MKVPFLPADILLPRDPRAEWSVIACDQYTSDSEYWEKVKKEVGGKPSTLDLILPEIYLNGDTESMTRRINEKMKEYLESGVFKEYPRSMIYVERTLPGGALRRGIVAAVDLEAYDPRPGSKSAIRATEQTVEERVPPRAEIRKRADIELPHVLLLIDDVMKTVIEPLSGADLETLYDYDLMCGGGHIKGKLIPSSVCETVENALAALSEKNSGRPLILVGDGNHSLAAAKLCYEQCGGTLMRYALAELCNLHDESIVFEPIYRVLFGADTDTVKAKLDRFFGMEKKGTAQHVTLVSGGRKEEYMITAPVSELTVGSVEKFIQAYLKEHPGTRVDYINGTDQVERLCAAGDAVGFLFDGMRKEELFPAVEKDGVLPRKTFSMGSADTKRFYTECRAIKSPDKIKKEKP